MLPDIRILGLISLLLVACGAPFVACGAPSPIPVQSANDDALSGHNVSSDSTQRLLSRRLQEGTRFVRASEVTDNGSSAELDGSSQLLRVASRALALEDSVMTGDAVECVESVPTADVAQALRDAVVGFEVCAELGMDDHNAAELHTLCEQHLQVARALLHNSCFAWTEATAVTPPSTGNQLQAPSAT